MASYYFGKTTFINPYNFIPLGTAPERNTDVEADNNIKHTGYFVCNLEAKTPLAIPDTAKREEDKKVERHFHYPAYKLNKKLVIPGSSIRGVIRSTYETLTNSCMVTLNPDEQITKRNFATNAYEPGLLVWNGTDWELHSAKRYVVVGKESDGYCRINGFKTFEIGIENNEKYLVDSDNRKLYFGEEVEITYTTPGHVNRRNQEVWGGHHVDSIKKGTRTGYYLFLGELFSKKHAESVFHDNGEIKTITLAGRAKEIEQEDIKKAILGIEETLNIYRSKSINRELDKKHCGYRGYDRAKRNGVIPIWYKLENGVLHFSMAAIGRITYNRTMKDLSINHDSCVNRKKLCPACSVFGMIGSGNTYDKGMGSRIRITDAEIINGGLMQGEYTLCELTSSRKSYLNFYSKGGQGYDDMGAAICGRKYYWHIPETKDINKKDIYCTDEKTDRNATFELINPKSNFTFKVYYEDLSDEQIDMLKWTLTLGEVNDKDKDCCHKIGHGKPLGLGSIKITVTDHYEREFGEDNYNVTEFNRVIKRKNKNTPDLLDGSAWDDFKIIANFNHQLNNIRYPYVIESDGLKLLGNQYKDNVLASHQWFSEFRKNRGILHSINEVLGGARLNGLELKEYIQDDLRYIGMIKSYNSSKEFGFITSDNQDYHFNKSDIQDDPSKYVSGALVSFEVKNIKRGPVAKNCRLIR